MSLACSYETARTGGDSDRLAHTLEVESWPASGVLAHFCCEHAVSTSPTANRRSGRLVCYLV